MFAFLFATLGFACSSMAAPEASRAHTWQRWEHVLTSARTYTNAYEWWQLEPAHNLIQHQPEDVTRHMVLAKTGAGDLAVAYLPNNEVIGIDMSALSDGLARGFNPVNGRYTPINDRVNHAGTHRFTPPEKGDWVLLLRRRE